MLKLHAERQDLGVAQVATLLEVDLLVGAVAVGVTLPPFDVRWGMAATSPKPVSPYPYNSPYLSYNLLTGLLCIWHCICVVSRLGLDILYHSASTDTLRCV